MTPHIRKIASDLEIPEFIIKELDENENDWGFIIKTCALLESSLTDQLTKRLNRPELKDFVSKLNLAGNTGKIKLGKALGLLQKEETDFLDGITHIRNKAAHSIKCAHDFSIENHLNSETKIKRDQLLKQLMAYAGETTPVDQKQNAACARPMITIGTFQFINWICIRTSRLNRMELSD